MRDLKKYEQDYAEQPYERFQVKNRKRKIKEILARYPHQRMLEIGCGLEPIFSEFTDFDSLVILEPGEQFFQHAQAALSVHPARERVDLFQATAEGGAALLADRTFDFVLLSGLLHEVAQPELLLSQVMPFVGPETLLHVNVPNALSFHRLLAVECGFIRSPYELSASNVQFQQSTVFDRQQLTALGERCGFEVIESGSYSFKPFTHQQMEAMLQSGVVSERIFEGLYAMEKYVPDCGSEIFMNLRKRTLPTEHAQQAMD